MGKKLLKACGTPWLVTKIADARRWAGRPIEPLTAQEFRKYKDTFTSERLLTDEQSLLVRALRLRNWLEVANT